MWKIIENNCGKWLKIILTNNWFLSALTGGCQWWASLVDGRMFKWDFSNTFQSYFQKIIFNYNPIKNTCSFGHCPNSLFLLHGSFLQRKNVMHICLRFLDRWLIQTEHLENFHFWYLETSWTNHGADKIALKVWILRIAGARPADSGLYQCQVLLMMLMVKIAIKMIMIFIMIILIFHHFSACW